MVSIVRNTILLALRVLVVMTIVSSITSCVTNKTTRYLQNEKENYAPAQPEYYRLQPNDELVISFQSTNKEALSLINNGTNNQMTNNTMTYRIYQDSTIDLPYVSKVKVAGLTIREANQYPTETLKPYVANDLLVKVAMSQKLYYIIGESGKGKFPIFKDNMNIFEALAQAGDMTLQADRKHIKILRRVNGKEKIFTFNIRSKDILDSEYYYIEPNDIIFVPQAKTAFFRITSFTTLISVVTSTLSFVLLVTNYVNN